MASRAKTFGEVEAKVRAHNFITPRITRVGGDVTAAWRGGFGEVFIFAVAARPFVVPDIEDCACLRWWLRFDG